MTKCALNVDCKEKTKLILNKYTNWHEQEVNTALKNSTAL